MAFEPIAIVGQSCLLPDASTPAALWANVLARRDSLGNAPAGRWRMPRAEALRQPAGERQVQDPDTAWHDVGGYVRDFDRVFDAGGFLLERDHIQALDPLFQWTLHGVREALRDAGRERADARSALIMGNLSFPSAQMARFAEHTWLGARGGRDRPHPHNRFNSGLPAHLAARALGFGGGFALDAACASSLYAIKLACDRLHDRVADLMVAGAVNCTDDLFIHMGFTALGALSPSGRSRPFHREADGLVPAEGAAFVTLKRLDDAVRDGDRIHGVIRGVGLSNDGRGRGLLVPSEAGQARAMRAAWAGAGLAPASATLIECHATGTAMGDGAEVRSMTEIFGAAPDLPIGSLKSNVGHLITVAGAAGLIKVLGAMTAGTRPPTLHADHPLDALQGSPLRLLRAAEPWNGLRRAGVSAFGFGGNNAHLIVDAWEGKPFPVTRTPASASAEPVAIVAIGARIGAATGLQDLTDALFEGVPRPSLRAASADVEVDLAGLRFPPRDIEAAHGQQLMMLEAGRDACRGLKLDPERTQLYIGMACDPEVARSGMRWRLPGLLAEQGLALSDLAAARSGIQVPLTAAGVLGTMPNIVANRLNSQLDLRGPGFSVSAEEASGIVALQLAARALRAGDADAALVGAVDLSHEPVHQAALEALAQPRVPGDAAVAMVLKRHADAVRDGDTVLALLDDAADDPAHAGTLRIGDTDDCAIDPADLCGAAHAAQGLLAVGIAALAVHHRARPRAGAAATPWLGARRARIHTSVLGAGTATIGLTGQIDDVVAPPGRGWRQDTFPRLYVYSGADRDDTIRALDAQAQSDIGPARLVIAASDATQLAARAQTARQWMHGGGPQPDGVAFSPAPVKGKIAFVFTGAAAAYPGMGRDLMLAFPRQLDAVQARAGSLDNVAAWLFGGPETGPRHPLDRLWGATIVSQLHAEISQRVLRMRPDATIGYSSGETNALFATGAWQDIEAMIADTMASDLFRHQLVPDFSAVRADWRQRGIEGERWESYAVSAPRASVDAALASEAAVHLMAINAPGAYTLGGEATACARVLARLPAGCAALIPYEVAVHAPELDIVRADWRSLHRRATAPVPGVRFYGCGNTRSYEADADAAADAITAQALGTLDFAGTVEQAWADGVRIFVEHGPRNVCSGWIGRILGEREHVAVALDRFDRASLQQLAHAIATLTAAGVALDHAALAALQADAPADRGDRPCVRVRAHWPPVQIPPLEAPVQVMQAAPWLPPVLAAARAAPRMPAVTPDQLDAPPPSTPAPVPPSYNSSTARPPVAPVRNIDPPMTRPSPSQHVAALHQEFIARQTAIHLQFLEMRQMAEQRLLQALALQGRPLPAPIAAAEAAPVLASMPAPAPIQVPVQAPIRVPAPVAAAPQELAIAAAPAFAVPPGPQALPGPKFSREDLEFLSHGAISALFGPHFQPQDQALRQTRMPMPPLLLADRVTGIDAVPASMQTGTIWTETDVRADSWYLSAEGRMPAGIMIESGQADLLLISWLGIDLVTGGDRVYRLLGCDLTFHGSLPVPGETLVYTIRIDSHARQGDIRLFFFHYDCHVNGELRMSVRQGQAGFFTDEELDRSGGVLWNPADEACDPAARLDPPFVACAASSFDAAAVQAFAEGRQADCFGAAWEATRAHVRPPRIEPARMRLIDTISAFDPLGGPWQRGYLRSETDITPDSWFFDGHFKNDPCMPGTLMFEGCLQAMAFYMSALGYTIERDGWRFEPVPEQRYRLRCRGQVRPTSKRLSCEVFIREVVDGDKPTIYADLLGTVDGVKAFHAQRVGLRMVPDWPLAHWSQLGPAAQHTLAGAPQDLAVLGGLLGYTEPKPVAGAGGFDFDYASLLACAWGRPSQAFGPFYKPFDGARTVARLPGPPYHFMSRVVAVKGDQGGMQQGSIVEAEYDVPPAAWYFTANGQHNMPLSVLMEVALQPCGWLASYVGCALSTPNDLLFRNLDGAATIGAEITPDIGIIATQVELQSISRNGDMIILTFALACSARGELLFKCRTVFGFFPKEAFANQVGMPLLDHETRVHDEPSEFFRDLRDAAPTGRDGVLRLPHGMLLMLDRVTGWWPRGGAAGLGRLRAEKAVRADEWYFKAHFFQDPVQPGSLGIEAMVQLLQFYLMQSGCCAGIPAPHVSLLPSDKLSWKYRGQVVPSNASILVDMEITACEIGPQGGHVLADAWLWVDGKRIYQCRNLGLRIAQGSAD